jgi:hypothetical protein
MPSLAKTLRRWYSTVLGLTKSCDATALLVAPSPTSRAQVALAGLLTGGPQLAPRALGPRRRAQPLEALQCGAQVHPRVDAPPVPAQVLAVVQVDARPVERTGAVDALDRRLEVRVGGVGCRRQGAAVGEHGQGPCGARDLRPGGEARQRPLGHVGMPGVHRRLQAIPRAQHGQERVPEARADRLDGREPHQRLVPAPGGEIELRERPCRQAGRQREPALERERQDLVGVAPARLLVASQPGEPGQHGDRKRAGIAGADVIGQAHGLVGVGGRVHEAAFP